MVKKVDSKTLGNKNSIPLEPYLKWVRTRTLNLMMPYEAILLIIKEPVAEGDVPYTVLYPDMLTSLEDMQIAWIQLKEERDTFKLSSTRVKRRFWSLQDSFMKSGV